MSSFNHGCKSKDSKLSSNPIITMKISKMALIEHQMTFYKLMAEYRRGHNLIWLLAAFFIMSYATAKDS